MALAARLSKRCVSLFKAPSSTLCIKPLSNASCQCSAIQQRTSGCTLRWKQPVIYRQNKHFSTSGHQSSSSGPFQLISLTKDGQLAAASSNYSKPLSRYNSSDMQTDFNDIKHMLKLKLEEKKIESDDINKQLGFLDVLFKHRLQHIDVSGFKEEAEKLKPSDVYSLASEIFSLQDKVGEEAALLSGLLFRHAAIAGDSDAKYSYAQLMRTGLAGIEPDPKEAASILSELAKEGHPYAQFALAGMYYSGMGVTQNFETAYTLYQIAAENRVSQGYNMIGKMYLQGQSVPVDHKKAFEYFKKGADQDDVLAFMSVAHCYTHAKGVEKNDQEAVRYHEMAAHRGYAPGFYNLGAHYFSGRGVELDMKKAAENFQKSADMGFDMAQINLGNMYYHGLGVEQDWQKARALYKKTAPKHHNARLLLEELEDEMKKKGMDIEE